MPELIVKSYFFECGKNAPKNSEFKGIVTHESVFGGSVYGKSSLKGGGSYFDYTAREKAVKESGSNHSFAGYTSRDNATEKSSDNYFTMSNIGHLYNDNDRKRFRIDAEKSFQKNGDLAWALVVSFENPDLKNLYGIDGQDDLSDIMNIAMNKTFLELGFDPNNMIWWEDMHTNTDNPHMHITFAERTHTRDRGKLTPTELSKMKGIIASEIIAKRRFRELYGMSHEKALQQSEELKREIVSEIKELGFNDYREIFNLYLQLPKTGRLQYNSTNMIPFREDLDKIVDKLLTVEPIAAEYKKYKTRLEYLANNINQTVNEKVTNIETAEDNKLKVQIANAVLKSMKMFSSNVIRENMKERKLESEKELLKNLDGILAPEYLASIKLAAKGNSKVAMDQILNTKDSPERNLALATVLMLHSDRENDWVKGYVLMNVAAKDGNKQAKKFINYHKKSYVLRKREHNYMKKTFSPYITAEISKVVSQKTMALENEMQAFLHSNDEIVAQTYDDIKIDSYVRKA
jgi:hypothetical protein